MTKCHVAARDVVLQFYRFKIFKKANLQIEIEEIWTISLAVNE